VIGGCVRALSMRDIESLCEQAGLGRPRARRSRGSARSCTSGSRRSLAARSTTSTWSCCSLDAIYLSVKDGKLRIQVLTSELEHDGYQLMQSRSGGSRPWPTGQDECYISIVHLVVEQALHIDGAGALSAA